MPVYTVTLDLPALGMSADKPESMACPSDRLFIRALQGRVAEELKRRGGFKNRVFAGIVRSMSEERFCARMADEWNKLEAEDLRFRMPITSVDDFLRQACGLEMLKIETVTTADG